MYPHAKCTGVCAASGQPLARGEAYVGTLVQREGPRGVIERADYSMRAWEEGARPQPPLVLLGSWKATYTGEEPRREALLSDAEVLDLFEELGETADPRQQSFRYMLALLLIRRRMLRQVGHAPDALVVLPRGSQGEPVRVPNPGMDDGAIADAIEQLGRIIATEPAVGS